MAYRFQGFYNGNISENHTSVSSGVFLRSDLKISLTFWSLVATRLYVFCSSNIYKFYGYIPNTQGVSEFCIVLGRNSDCFPIN